MEAFLPSALMAIGFYRTGCGKEQQRKLRASAVGLLNKGGV